MRLMMLVVVLAMNAAAADAIALQSGNRGAANKTFTGACAILTKDLLAAHSPASKESFNLINQFPPQEEKAGGGSSCEYGGVMLQVDPFPVSSVDRLFGKWTPVAGVGDRAFFRDNQGEWAELAVVSGGRLITIQMDVPTGKTAAGIQPNTIALAKAVLAKLK